MQCNIYSAEAYKTHETDNNRITRYYLIYFSLLCLRPWNFNSIDKEQLDFSMGILFYIISLIEQIYQVEFRA